MRSHMAKNYSLIFLRSSNFDATRRGQTRADKEMISDNPRIIPNKFFMAFGLSSYALIISSHRFASSRLTGIRMRLRLIDAHISRVMYSSAGSYQRSEITSLSSMIYWLLIRRRSTARALRVIVVFMRCSSILSEQKVQHSQSIASPLATCWFVNTAIPEHERSSDYTTQQ